MAVTATVGRRRGWRWVSPAALAPFPSFGDLLALPDPRSERVDRSGGKPRYHHGNRQPSGRVTSLSSPYWKRLLQEGAGESWKGAPRAAGSALTPWTALFFCSALGGRTGTGPRPVGPPSSFPPPQQVCVPGSEPASVHRGNGRSCGRFWPDSSREAPGVFLILG